jgi:ArsR family transcriptional regulator, arsenate/arsenite/antimonite-responsive transcriptional repressor
MGSTVGHTSIVVNIDASRYYDGMTRRDDPDAQLLHALGDPMRLAIVRQLATEHETCACDLTVGIELSQPTVSHHLRVLRQAGIVGAERRGTWVFYTLQPDAIERLARLVRELTPPSAGGGIRQATGEALAGRRLPVLEI